TLLNLIAGLDRPTSGTVTVAGERVDRLNETGVARVRRPKVGMIFQFFNLLDDLTVLGNGLLPAPPGGVARGPGRAPGGELPGRPSCWPRCGSARTGRPTRPGCPVASGSGWRSPARW